MQQQQSCTYNKKKGTDKQEGWKNETHVLVAQSEGRIYDDVP